LIHGKHAASEKVVMEKQNRENWRYSRLKDEKILGFLLLDGADMTGARTCERSLDPDMDISF
jgi:hypothetical protein